MTSIIIVSFFGFLVLCQSLFSPLDIYELCTVRTLITNIFLGVDICWHWNFGENVNYFLCVEVTDSASCSPSLLWKFAKNSIGVHQTPVPRVHKK